MHSSIKATLIVLSVIGLIGLIFGCTEKTSESKSYYMIKFDGKWVNCSYYDGKANGVILRQCSIGGKHHSDIFMATNFTEVEVK